MECCEVAPETILGPTVTNCNCKQRTLMRVGEEKEEGLVGQRGKTSNMQMEHVYLT